jgi:hypothetical protein
MKKVAAFLMVFLFCGLAQAQQTCPLIETNYAWLTGQDYQQDQERVIEVLKWLCKTPMGEEVKQRSVANAYVMEWLAGTPNLRLELDISPFSLFENYPELLFPFVHGAALYALQRPTQVNTAKLHAEGFEVVAQLAQQSEILSKEAEVKKLIKAYRKKTLEDFYSTALEEQKAFKKK